MKSVIAGFVLVAALAGCSSAPDVRLPVAKIDEHATRLLELMRAADLDKDGDIEGGEWYALGASAVGHLVQVATELAQRAAAEAAARPQN